MLDYLCRNNCALARADFGNEMAPIGCTNDRTPLGHDPVGSFAIENDVIFRPKQPFETITKTDHLPTEFLCCEHHSAQDGIQPRAIATTGQNTNPWLHFGGERRLKQFLWIGQTPAGGPLVEELPAACDKSSAFAESIGAAKQHHDQMTRIDGYRLALGYDFRLAIGGENQAVTRSRCPASFHSVNAISSEKLVRAPKHIIESVPAAIERDLTFLLRHIKAKTCFVQRVTRQTRHVFRSRKRHRSNVVVNAVRIDKACALHLQLFG